jgi:hypothetical protein
MVPQFDDTTVPFDEPARQSGRSGIGLRMSYAVSDRFNPPNA